MTPTTDTMLTPALDAVAMACRVANAVQADLDDIREITKDDRSPVTVADFAVQAVVALAMKDAEPGVKIVGEEHAGVLRQDDQTHVRKAVVEAVQSVRPDATEDDVLNAIDDCDHDGSGASYWTLDPVDGTKGFLRGQQYAIALGKIENGEVTVGVMGCPNLPATHDRPLTDADSQGIIYMATKGNGAFEISTINPGDAPVPIGAGGGVAGVMRVCESVEKGHSKQSDTERILEHMGASSSPVRLDSQCKYAVVARGQADAYLRLPTRADYREKIWDHAAGMIIATEAGAVVTDISGKPLDFSKGEKLEDNRGVICATPDVHSKIIEAIKALGIGSGS